MFSFLCLVWFCFIYDKATHAHTLTHTSNVHVTQNSEFNNWSNWIQCNWLKLRNFINIQWNIRFDDIETSELIGSTLCSLRAQHVCMCLCVCAIFSALATMQCHWQTRKSIFYSYVICNWISFPKEQWDVNFFLLPLLSLSLIL